MTDVLLASSASGGARRSRSAKISCFSATFSGAASITISAVADRIRQPGLRRHAIDRGGIEPEIGEIAGDPPFQARQCAGHGIEDRDLVAGDGEDLGDAMAHQAGADDANSCLCCHATLLRG